MARRLPFLFTRPVPGWYPAMIRGRTDSILVEVVCVAGAGLDAGACFAARFLPKPGQKQWAALVAKGDKWTGLADSAQRQARWKRRHDRAWCPGIQRLRVCPAWNRGAGLGTSTFRRAVGLPALVLPLVIPLVLALALALYGVVRWRVDQAGPSHLLAVPS
jgi:hypothetical protein